MLSGGTGNTIFKCWRFSSFLIIHCTYSKSFLLKIVLPFFYERFEGLRAVTCRLQERHCPANKIVSLLHKHYGKEQVSENNAA